jgi:transcriptional regulator with XRE-family HTH domain
MFTVKHNRANTPAAPTGQALKKMLSRKGWSYRFAASELGTHASYLSDILNARRGHPGYALRARLANLLEELN